MIKTIEGFIVKPFRLGRDSFHAVVFEHLEVVVVAVRLRIRSTQKPRYSKNAVLKNPHVRQICDFSAIPTTTREVVQAFLRMIWKI